LDFPEVFKVSDVQNLESWKLPMLKQISQRGDTSFWVVFFECPNMQTYYFEEHHLTGLRMNEKSYSREIVTNSSGRGINEQAFQECFNRFRKKKRTGYSNLEDPNFSHFLELQLATDYQKSNGSRIDLKFPVICQPKLDGLRARCIFSENKDSKNYAKLYTRNKLELRFLENVKAELSVFRKYMDENYDLDGELYIHEIPRWTIQSFVMGKSKHPRNDEVNYYIFDIIMPETSTESRIKTLYEIFENARFECEFRNIKLVHNSYVNSELHLHKYMETMLDLGYEGLIIRHSEFLGQKSFYKGKRNCNLIKFTTSKESEDLILDVISGESGKGTNDLAIFMMQMESGKTFTIVPRGTHEERREFFINKDKLVGLKYCYKYRELSDDGIPQFPVGIDFRYDI